MSRRVLAVARYFDRFVHADGFAISSHPKTFVLGCLSLLVGLARNSAGESRLRSECK